MVRGIVVLARPKLLSNSTSDIGVKEIDLECLLAPLLTTCIFFAEDN